MREYSSAKHLSEERPPKRRRVWPLAMAGGLLYAMGLTPAPPAIRIPLNFVAACAVTLAVARWYASKFPGQRKRTAACAVFVALVPTWLFAHLIAAAWLLPLHELAPKWFWLLSAAGYGGPAWLVWRLARSSPEQVRKLAIAITANLVIVALTLGALEVGLRVTGMSMATAIARSPTGGGPGLFPIGAWLWLLTGRNRVLSAKRIEYFTVYPSDPRGYFEPGGRVTYRTNSTGFRDEDFLEQRSPGTLRIALLGDSIAMGIGVKAEDLAARRLESLLTAKAGCPVEVYNFALGGYDTSHEADLLESTVWNYRPDLVIIWYSMGDVQPLAAGRRSGVLMNSPWLAPAISERSKLAEVLEDRLERMSYGRIHALNADNYNPEGQNWKEWRETLRRMARSAQNRHAPMMLFAHPETGYIGKNEQTRERRQVVEAAREFGMKAYDLLPAFAGYSADQLVVHPIDFHPNEIGHRLAAEYATDPIAEVLPACPQ